MKEKPGLFSTSVFLLALGLMVVMSTGLSIISFPVEGQSNIAEVDSISIGDDGDMGIEFEEGETIIGKTSNLEMHAAIGCKDDDRGGGYLIPYLEWHFWYDGAAEINSPHATSLGLKFEDKAECCSGGGSVGCGNKVEDNYCGACESGNRQKLAYGWPEKDLDCYDSYEGAAYEPYLEIDFDAIGYPNSPILFRYEGDCTIFARVSHEKYPSADKRELSSQDPQKYFVFGEDSGNWVGSEGNPYRMLPGFFDYSVDWDNDKSQCEMIGGAWLDDGDIPGITAGNYEGYRCCGDDWIWLYNIPYDYEDPDSDNFCLWRSEGAYGYPVLVEGMGEYDDDSVRCSEPIGRQSYDPVLADKDVNQDISWVGSRHAPFYFVGSYPKETDIGKWSDKDSKNPIYCSHEYIEGEGEVFDWITIEEAAEKNQLICEVYLGYNWTGQGCCGYDEKTYEDAEESCNGKSVATWIAEQTSIAFSSPAFEQEFFDECENTKILNNACFEGRAIGHEKTTYSDEDETRFDVYSEEGELYFCKHTGGTPHYTEFAQKDKCEIMGDEVRDFHICGYTNDSWFDASDAQAFMGLDILNLEENSLDHVKSTLVESELPVEVSLPKKECCFSGSCWDGEKCVAEEEGRYIFNTTNKHWGPYDTMIVNDEDIEYYVCEQGEWHNSKPKYNWYFDTSDIGLCAQDFACYCKETGYDYYDSYDCSGGNILRDCTTIQNYYKDDHYCQAFYGAGEQPADSQWTTRTKLIAGQLLEVAGRDYTLYCDIADNSVNYPIDLKQTRYPLNNVCVLKSGDKKAVGFSFNPALEIGEGSLAVEDHMREFIFSFTNGFATTIIGEEDGNAEMCNALLSPQNKPHGEFVQCLNPTLWANNKTLSVIYAEHGLGDTEKLPSPDYGLLQKEMFEDEKKAIRDAITKLPAGAPPYFGTYKYPSDFSRLYIMKEGSKSIFATIEQRYDKYRTTPPKLMNYMSVHYSGFDSTCTWVEFVKGRDNLDIWCVDMGNDEAVVFARTSTQYPDYWKDLTAKLRLES